jgi:D,D-heptose 1,7-bisphosphate phosphatase
LNKNEFSVVINAGGLGTRLSAMYNGLPKALVPVFDEPIIIDQINKFINQGFKEFVILLGHKAYEIKAVIEQYYSKSQLKIKFLIEGSPLGSGGSLLYFMNDLPENFIFTYCDILFDLNVEKLLRFHLEKNSDMTVVVHPNDHPNDSDLVSVKAGGLISAIKSHPHNFEDFTGNLVNAAFYVINRTCLLQTPFAESALDFAQDIMPNIVENANVYAYQTPEFIKDMGTPSRLSKVRQIYANRFRNTTKNRVICLDRDGTVNRFKEGEYITHVNEFELIEGVGEAISILRDLGYFVVCVTNQPIIARGDASVNDLKAIHSKMDWLLANHNAYFDGVYICPHHPDSGHKGEVSSLKFDCECRKPKTGLLEHVMSYIPFDCQNSWFVGDSWRDIMCGQSFGMKTCSIGDVELDADMQVASVLDFAKNLQQSNVGCSK